jgi:hypothetical protein
MLLLVDELGHTTSQAHSQSFQSRILNACGELSKSQVTVTVVVFPTLFEVTELIPFHWIPCIPCGQIGHVAQVLPVSHLSHLSPLTH